MKVHETLKKANTKRLSIKLLQTSKENVEHESSFMSISPQNEQNKVTTTCRVTNALYPYRHHLQNGW